QETMTDPSYHRQILVTTAPHIGNTGWNDEDNESNGCSIWIAGLVIRNLSHHVSTSRAKRTLEVDMKEKGIVGIQCEATRTLVRHLLNEGSIAAGIFSGDAASRPVEELIEEVKAQDSMAGADLSAEVSTDEVYTIPVEGEKKYTVVAYDMGIKL